MSFVFANSETETFWESCLIAFPTTPPCSTRVDVLETGDVPILFSLPQMKNLGTSSELDPQGHKITCPSFGLCSFLVEYSLMWHIVLDLTCFAYQPKSRERSDRPTKHVIVALMPQKSAYPAHSQELDDDEDDKTLVRSDRTTVSEHEDDKPLVHPASRSETVKRESAANRIVTTPSRRRKGPPVWRNPSATLEQDVSGNSRERSGEVSSMGKNSDREASRTLSTSCWICATWRTDTWSITTCHLHSSRREQLTWIFLERFTTFTNTWWRHAHSAIQWSRVLTDHAWVDWEQKNLEIPSSWIFVLRRLETKPFDFWLFWLVRLRT